MDHSMAAGGDDTPLPIDLTAMRRGYRRQGVSPADLGADPLVAFARWLDDAVSARLTEPNAMTLATAEVGGQVSARTVLLKSVGEDGFVFFTNYGSRKARQLSRNPCCSLVFAWVPLARQVVVTGTASRVTAQESDAYFATRPRGSQLGAWASPQSEVVADRAELAHRFAEAQRRFPREVPRPPQWGGFRVAPDSVEFWQGRPDRLHDRIRYRRGEGEWIVERLAP